MKTNPKHPGVYVQPPLFGLAVFILGWYLQKWIPIDDIPKHHVALQMLAGILFASSAFFGLTGVYRFFKADTTVETFKPATSLQTKGIFERTRNPMYLGLLGLYVAVSILFGNWWTTLFTVLFFLILNFYVIPAEENYLSHAFGKDYLNYKRRVRRWFGKKRKS